MKTIAIALLSLSLCFSIARADQSIIAPEQSTIAVLDKVPETEAYEVLDFWDWLAMVLGGYEGE